MLRTPLLIALLLFTTNGFCQYFQQNIDYTLDARYDKETHVLNGTATIDYTNNAPQALDTIYLHLWVNAFKSKQSPYTEQSIKLGKRAFYFAKEEKMGGYDSIKVSASGRKMELHYASDEIAYIILSTPLKTTTSLRLDIDYSLCMPYLFDRFGWKKDRVQLVHWYPSVAVYDEKGWHAMPYLLYGEHYPTVASYNVNVILPFKTVVSSGAIDGSERVDNMTDFTIIADDNAVANTQNIDGIDVTLMHYDNTLVAQNGFEYTKDLLDFFTETVGAYPYKTLAIVESPKNSNMEYGALVTLEANDTNAFRYYLAHELGHQWFYGALASNQRMHGWMDEGFTMYYQQRYFDKTGLGDYYTNRAKQKDKSIPILQKMATYQAKRQFAQPIGTSIENVHPFNYGLNNYVVTAQWIKHLAGYIGQVTFDEAMQSFYDRWTGKNPNPEHLQQHLEEASGKKLDWFFNDLIHNEWAVDYEVEQNNGSLTVTNNGTFSPPYTLTADGNTTWNEGHGGTKKYDLKAKNITLGPLNSLIDQNPRDNSTAHKSLKINLIDVQLPSATQNNLYYSPLVNYSYGDGFMLGAALFNTNTPKAFKFLVAPQYGFKSKRLVGTAWTSYDHYLESASLRKMQGKLVFKSYDQQYITTLKQPLKYTKVAPSISLHFRHQISSDVYSKLTLTPIFLKLERYDFANNKSIFESNKIFQLQYDRTNSYALSPSKFTARLEYQPYETPAEKKEQYLKLNSSYKQTWYYNPMKKISTRLFASYFIQNSKRNSSSYNSLFTRGSTALLHQGFNDYTYEEYWFNRNNQNVILDNQISTVGGGFKTALGSQYAIGQTNDLALAINIEADIPARLPKFLPLAVYFDLGYYTSKGTESDALKGNTIYNAGLALNYGKVMSVYFPLFSSKNITDAYASEGANFLGKITFRLDLDSTNPWEIIEDINHFPL